MSAQHTEQFQTISQASSALGIPAYALRRAAKSGLIPVYRRLSNRWVVRLSEVEAAIRATQIEGGDQ